MESIKKHSDLLIGSRETNISEPKTFNEFIAKAKNLGFSENEIERLQECYLPKARRPML